MSVGERALVAHDRGDGLFDVRYSHWGAGDLRLRADIGPNTPLGGDAAGYEPEYVNDLLVGIENATGDTDTEVEGRLVEAGAETPVDPEPFETGISIEAVCELVDTVDFRAEALYVVTPAFDARAFRPLSVPFDERGTLLIEPRWGSDGPVGDERERRFGGYVDALGSFVAEGAIDETEAAERAVDALLERYEEHPEKQVLAPSTAVTDADLARRPTAFAKMEGMMRVGGPEGHMAPVSYRDAETWERPAALALPKTVDFSGTLGSP